MRIEAGVATDIGQVREGNEDSYLVEPPLFAVADGMGGHRGGEVASQLALETVETLFRAGTGTLVDQVRAANQAVFARSAADRKVSGMGTTLTAVQVLGDVAHLAHVGDSRAYLLRAGSLRQLTDDHTLVQRMVQAGEITAEEADVHPHRNVLTRSLGTDPDVVVDEQDVGLLEGDRVLLCSDGLTSMVTEGQMQAILEATPAAQEAADRLVRAANRAGGVDNITVVVLAVRAGDAGQVGAGVTGGATAAARPGHAPPSPVTPGGGPTVGDPASGGSRRVVRWVVAAVALLVLVVAGATGFRGWVDGRWYVGVANGHVAVYQGIPATVLGFELSHVDLETDILAADAEALPLYANLADGLNANGRDDALHIVDQIRRDLRKAGRAALGGGA